MLPSWATCRFSFWTLDGGGGGEEDYDVRLPVISWESESDVRRRCNSLEIYHQFFICMTQIIIGIMLIVRTYALYERSKRILVFMIFFSICVVVLGVWGIARTIQAPAQGGAVPLFIGCADATTRPEAVGLLTAWGVMGLFDCMIFVLTLFRTLTRGLWYSRSDGTIPRELTGLYLVKILIRDG
ncbi:hypothetical protein C8F01DRAFT_1032369, partial [Mycena amicta]